ncbi:MAG: hypothetical protein ACREQ5_39345 [Candidatus Dormibacteria bacterium]
MKESPELIGYTIEGRRVKSYFSGWHPDMKPHAVLHEGLTGRETIVESDIIKPMIVINWYDRKPE